MAEIIEPSGGSPHPGFSWAIEFGVPAARRTDSAAIAGEIVTISAHEIAIRRHSDKTGDVVVHFPRAGFVILPLE